MLLILLFPISGSADSGHIVINEVQIGQSGSGNANNEFVEIYNPTGSDIDLSALSFKLHIRNSNGTDNNKTLTFKNKVVPLKGFFLIAPNNDYGTSIGADATYSVTSGNKLVDNGGVYISTSTTANVNIIDKVGWGSQPVGGYEEMPYNPSIPVGQSIKREPDGHDTDNNGNDFVIAGEENAGENVPSNNNGSSINGVYINELMPDPASPKSDTVDEWIELYNDSDTRVDLSGAILKDTVGVVFEYVIPGGTFIDSKRYAVFYRSATNITLNNDGDSVELLDRSKALVGETPNYGKTRSGDAFALFPDGWEWTNVPTPSAENKFGGTNSESETSSGGKTANKKTSKTSAKVANDGSKTKGKTSINSKVKGAKVTGADDTTADSTKEAGKKLFGNNIGGLVFIIISIILGINYLIFRKRIYDYFEQKN